MVIRIASNYESIVRVSIINIDCMAIPIVIILYSIAK